MTRAWLAIACAACGAASPSAPPPGAASRCATSGDAISCTSRATHIAGRLVTYELPLGTPPATGWPNIVFFQGSFVPGSHAFAAAKTDPFGQYELTETIAALLDRGYAVIAPDALGNGSLYWQTNIPPYATSWAGCDDDVLVRALLAATADGTFGELDPARRYAMGISSGGFMTSRMAVSYPEQFRGLAIASASYATCGATCTVPDLPPDHPPTLFLHGGADSTVPVGTMTPYRDKLVAGGRVAEAIIDPAAGHAWLAQAVAAVPDWVDAH